MKNLVYDINKLKYSIIVNLGGDLSSWSKSYINSKEELGMFYNMFLEECVMDMGIVLDGSFNFNSNYLNNIKSLFNDINNDKYDYSYRIGLVLLDFIINYDKYNNDSNYYDSIKDFNVDVDSYIYEGEDNKSIRISLIYQQV